MQEHRDGLHQHTYATITSYRPVLFLRGTQEPRQEHVKHIFDALFTTLWDTDVSYMDSLVTCLRAQGLQG
jgi:hypothetical protein